jgi:hypothetical protein
MGELLIIGKAIGYIIICLAIVIPGIAIAIWLWTWKQKTKLNRYIFFLLGYAAIGYWARGWGWEGESGIIMFYIVYIMMLIVGTVFNFAFPLENDAKGRN